MELRLDRPRSFLSGLAGIVCLGAVVAGCGGGVAGGGDGSEVRLVNATLENTSLDLKADSDTVVSGVGTLEASQYEDIDKGDYTIRVVANGATAASTTATVDKDSRYTAVAYSSAGTVSVTWLDENEDDADSGEAKLRILHTDATNVGAVDAYLITGACSTLESSSSAALATGVSGLQSGFSEVSADKGGTAYHLCITSTGDRSDVLLEIPALTLTSKEVVTVVLARSTGGALLNAIVLPQDGTATQALNTSARVRIAVGTSPAAPVTASASGVSLGVSLPTGGVGTYKAVPAGPVGLTLSIGGTTVGVPEDPSVAAGSDVTLLVTGSASAPVVTTLLDDNNASTSTTKPVKVRLVNGMANSGTATLTVDFDAVGNGATYPGASSYSQVAASAGLARVEVTGAATYCLSTAVTLLSGSVYSVFILGDAATLPSTPPTCTLRLDR